MSVKVLGVFKGAKETRELPAGTVIFEEGSTGEEMFGVISGRVELRMANGHSFSLGPDDTFGEMAMVDASPRSATAVAVEDSTDRRHRQAPVPVPGRRDAELRPAGDGEPGRAAAGRPGGALTLRPARRARAGRPAPRGWTARRSPRC